MDEIDEMVSDSKFKISLSMKERYIRVTTKIGKVEHKVGHPFGIPSLIQVYPEVSITWLSKPLVEIEKDIFKGRSDKKADNLFISIRNENDVILITKGSIYHQFNASDFNDLEKGIIYDLVQEKIVFGIKTFSRLHLS